VVDEWRGGSRYFPSPGGKLGARTEPPRRGSVPACWKISSGASIPGLPMRLSSRDLFAAYSFLYRPHMLQFFLGLNTNGDGVITLWGGAITLHPGTGAITEQKLKERKNLCPKMLQRARSRSSSQSKTSASRFTTTGS